MCWSAPASLILGTTGIATAVYASKKGETSDYTYPLAFFAAMEFLQFFSYFWIGQCSFAANAWLTTISYVHVAFQPLFMNIFFMYWLPHHIRIQVRYYVYGICVVLAGLTIAKLFAFYPDTLCALGQVMCGPQMCTVPGTWHLGWSVPYYNWPVPFDAFVYYAIGTFIVPLFYGAWRSVVTTIVTGPLIAIYLSSGNMQEWPAIWCFYSIILIIGGLFSHVHGTHKPAKLYRLLFRIIKYK
jgi:hypothetical protein